MEILKAGCILIDVKNKRTSLIIRDGLNGCEFPKGHLELNETLKQCAVRETEEETGRACKIITDFEHITVYKNAKNKVCKYHTYLAIDNGPTKNKIADKDKEKSIWKNLDEVETILAYDNLKEVWKHAMPFIKQICEGK